jgi:ABC-type multidrug transport system ATPase subunit
MSVSGQDSPAAREGAPGIPIVEAREMMGLTEAKNRLVQTYSGGMARRLEIAQSTLHRPAVLFLDEPTVGLDPGGRQAVWRHVDIASWDWRPTLSP